MNKDKELEVAKVVNKVFKTNVEEMLKKVEEKYTEVIKERVTNDVHNQNFSVKQDYPEKCYLSFVLKNGEFVVPYDIGTYLELSFSKKDSNVPIKTLKINTTSKELPNINELLTLVKEYDYCKIKSITNKDLELFDEDALKEEIIKRVNHIWTQDFEGFYHCEDVIGIYQHVSKVEKAETQA